MVWESYVRVTDIFDVGLRDQISHIVDVANMVCLLPNIRDIKEIQFDANHD